VDVRVLAATHRDLQGRVAQGAFRDDLYWRLAVVHLEVPPLRQRPEDLPVLARHFLARFADRFGVAPLHVPEALFDRLAAHDWPGNVRELEHALETLVALSEGGELDLSLLPARGPAAPDEAAAGHLRPRLEAYERGLLVEALRAAGGNRSEAARRLGISRVTLHDKLKKHGLGGAGEA
jgi:DNA-binding NtrC family response regulator